MDAERRSRPALAVLRALAVALVIGLSSWCAGSATLWFLFGSVRGYDRPVDVNGWMRDVETATREFSSIVVLLAVGLLAGATLIVTGAIARSAGMAWTGACSSLLVVALLAGVAVTGGQRLAEMTWQASAAVGQEPAVDAPPPPIETPPVHSAADARTEIRRMLDVSLAAALGPVIDDRGVPVDAAQLLPASTACGDAGAELTLSLAFSTADNARSLAAILGAWDEAGYRPDRAMGVDIRYSETLAVSTLEIRDRSSIDGLLRMTIRSACTVAE